MFTSLVSWLLAACVPGLLMLATFGLQRLEAGLADDSAASTKELTELIESAAPRPDTAPRAIARRPEPVFPTVPPVLTAFAISGSPIREEPGLPTRRYASAAANPQFRATQHTNRV